MLFHVRSIGDTATQSDDFRINCRSIHQVSHVMLAAKPATMSGEGESTETTTPAAAAAASTAAMTAEERLARAYGAPSPSPAPKQQQQQQQQLQQQDKDAEATLESALQTQVHHNFTDCFVEIRPSPCVAFLQTSRMTSWNTSRPCR